jgi:hypothetical protein
MRGGIGLSSTMTNVLFFSSRTLYIPKVAYMSSSLYKMNFGGSWEGSSSSKTGRMVSHPALTGEKDLGARRRR